MLGLSEQLCLQAYAVTEEPIEIPSAGESKGGSEVKPQVSVELKGDSNTEVKHDASSEVKHDTSTEVKHETSTEVKHDTSADVKHDTSTEVRHDTSAEVKPDASAEAKHGVSIETQPQVSSETKAEAKHEIKSEANAVLTSVESPPIFEGLGCRIGNWYLGFNGGYALSNVNSNSVTAALNAKGVVGTAETSNGNRAAWNVYFGYDFFDFLALEVGYANLGKISTSLRNVGAATAGTIADIMPYSGYGPTYSALGKYPLSDEFSVFAKVGLFSWQTAYTYTDQNGVSTDYVQSGTQPTVGAGFEMIPSSGFLGEFRFRLGWDLYQVHQSMTHLVSIGIVY